MLRDRPAPPAAAEPGDAAHLGVLLLFREVVPLAVEVRGGGRCDGYTLAGVSASWFLLSVLSVRQLFALAHEREEIEAVLLDALEVVVMAGAFTTALSATLDKAPHASPDQRADLRHGLEHAQHGEFGRAVPPLMVGLEGALWSVAGAHRRQ